MLISLFAKSGNIVLKRYLNKALYWKYVDCLGIFLKQPVSKFLRQAKTAKS